MYGTTVGERKLISYLWPQSRPLFIFILLSIARHLIEQTALITN